MKNFSIAALCFVLGVSLGLPGGAAAQGCVPFQNIDHCPLGAASLEELPDGGGLLVTGLGADANDGVASRFASSVDWNAQTSFPEGTALNRTVHLAAVSGGEVTAELLVEATEGRYFVGAAFTGSADESTYAVLVYRQGILQGGVGGFSSNIIVPGAGKAASPQGSLSVIHDTLCDRCRPTVEIGPPDEPPNWWYEYLFGRYDNNFRIRGGGGCSWGMAFLGDVLVSLPDGTEWVGDEIRIDEEVSGPGHYPYLGFESIEIRSSVPELTIIDEIVASTE